MLPRLLVTVAALGLFGTRADPVHYKIEVKSGQSMDMSALGQGVMNVNINATSFVAVTSRDSSGVTLLHVVVDSSVLDAKDLPAGMDAATMKVPNGAAFDLSVVGGKLQGIDPQTMESSPGMGLVIAGVALLFPPQVKSGLKVGDNWIDTVTTDTVTALGKGTSTQIRKWKASAKEGDAIVLDNDFTGTMSIGGGMATIEATSSGTSHVSVPPKGPARQASNETKTNVTMTIAAAPTPIQMTITGSVSIVPIK